MSSKMSRQGLRRRNFITRHPALLLTLGFVGWLEAIFTIEWSFPYCSSQEDGPESAVFGMPLPYIRWTGVSSLEYELMPLIWVLNIVILSAIAFPFVSWAVKKVGYSRSRQASEYAEPGRVGPSIEHRRSDCSAGANRRL